MPCTQNKRECGKRKAVFVNIFAKFRNLARFICAHAGLKLEPAATASSDIPEHDLKTSLRNIFSNIDSQRASAARNVCFKKDPQLNSYLHNFFRQKDSELMN